MVDTAAFRCRGKTGCCHRQHTASGSVGFCAEPRHYLLGARAVRQLALVISSPLVFFASLGFPRPLKCLRPGGYDRLLLKQSVRFCQCLRHVGTTAFVSHLNVLRLPRLCSQAQADPLIAVLKETCGEALWLSHMMDQACVAAVLRGLPKRVHVHLAARYGTPQDNWVSTGAISLCKRVEARRRLLRAGALFVNPYGLLAGAVCGTDGREWRSGSRGGRLFYARMERYCGRG